MSVAPSGIWAVSCGADRTLRLWERTDEPLVLGDIDENAEEELVTGEKVVCHITQNYCKWQFNKLYFIQILIYSHLYQEYLI